ncbi:hypothetical protein GOV14_03965 [Candidatus Pacearchaeota archaeon]|nr:hypothetical protein [Candidatus Pacearchaeota archaeon]
MQKNGEPAKFRFKVNNKRRKQLIISILVILGITLIVIGFLVGSEILENVRFDKDDNATINRSTELALNSENRENESPVPDTPGNNDSQTTQTTDKETSGGGGGGGGGGGDSGSGSTTPNVDPCADSNSCFGPELVRNGEFESGDYWAMDGRWMINGRGEAFIWGPFLEGDTIQQDIGVKAGSTYMISFNYRYFGSNNLIQVSLGGSPGRIYNTSVFSELITAINTGNLTFTKLEDSPESAISSVSVREVLQGGYPNYCSGEVDPVCDSYCDRDGDGYSTYTICLDSNYSFGDCDDFDANRSSGQDELCDGFDNDCNNETNDGFDEEWYNQPTTCDAGGCVSTGVLHCVLGNQVDSCITDCSGTELVLNGEFDSTDYWAMNGSWTIDRGWAYLWMGDVYGKAIQQDIGVKAGNTYNVSFYFSTGYTASDNAIQVSLGGTLGRGYSIPGFKSELITATDTGNLTFIRIDEGGELRLDSVSVKEVLQSGGGGGGGGSYCVNDNDGDRYGVGPDFNSCLSTDIDCDDSDNQIVPNRNEICGNGIDDNCNDLIDDAEDSCPVSQISSNSCMVMDTDNMVYTLTDDILFAWHAMSREWGGPGSLYNCFELVGNGITLDCNGHSLLDDGGGSRPKEAIVIKGNYNTVKNCDISLQIESFNSGILLRDGASNNIIENIMINNTYSGVWMWNDSYNNQIINVVSTNNEYGLYMSDNFEDTNTITGSTFCDNNYDLFCQDEVALGFVDNTCSGSCGIKLCDNDCGECDLNRPCTQDGLEVCDLSTSLCVECLEDTDCPNLATCDPESHSCISVCTNDNDYDGYGSGPDFNGCFSTDIDCDDSDANINPGKDELCDGFDNDCNSGTVDGSDEAWYNQQTTCGVEGCASTGIYDCISKIQVDTCIDICDYSCANDNDGDRYGIGPDFSGCISTEVDCDDSDNQIVPNRNEICGNGIDDNCNNLIDDAEDSCPASQISGSSCRVMDTDNMVYTLTADIMFEWYEMSHDWEGPGTLQNCFEIIGDGITLDCNGHRLIDPISAGRPYDAIVIFGSYNTVKNCNMSINNTGDGSGILIRSGASNNRIENIAISDTFSGVEIHNNSYNNQIINVVSTNNQYGFYMPDNFEDTNTITESTFCDNDYDLSCKYGLNLGFTDNTCSGSCGTGTCTNSCPEEVSSPSLSPLIRFWNFLKKLF